MIDVRFRARSDPTAGKILSAGPDTRLCSAIKEDNDRR
jgi:hypothetical protein